MPRKPHLYFRGEQLLRDDFRYPRRNIQGGNQPNPTPDYRPMQDTFRQNLFSFTRKRRIREERRNPEIDVSHMDFIQLNFFDVFKLSDFEKIYRDQFGLTPVAFRNYNRSGLFAVENQNRFKTFIRNVQTFIDADDPLDDEEDYSPSLRFIREFDGFSTEEMLGISESHSNVVIDLFRTLRLYNDFFEPVRERLLQYLDGQGIPFDFNPQSESLELLNPEWATIIEIANNFDVIQRISSHDSGVVQPSRYGQPIREFGFTVITDLLNELPIIGVLDSGVGDNNPLKPLLIEADPTYDLTNTDPFNDNIDHGTGVAGLAALGQKTYPDFTGVIEPDARILPIKIIHENGTPVSQNGVLQAIRRANHELGVRIFVLSVGWEDFKRNHETQSGYTLALDQIANELDILLFISTGNRKQLLRSVTELIDYPDHFLEEQSNLQTPADSMNNVTVGAIADNLSGETFGGFSIDNNLPAVYSRKFHYDWTDDLKRSIINHKLVKPDILMSGGDYDRETNPDVYGMQVLSSIPGVFFNKTPGTSYAAPLAANLAAKLLKRYPEITDMQTIKALLINSSREVRLGHEFGNFSKPSQIGICGYGKPNEDACLYSDNHRATFIIEGSIRPERMEIFELKLPEYLLLAQKGRGLLKIHTTLCFKFDPVPDNQLAYCPVHFAFGFFRNVSLEEIRNGNLGDIKLKQGWTEDYYFGDGLLSNTQKVDFSISKPDLVNESNTVRIGVHSRLHKHLDAAQQAIHGRAHSYSLAVSIEETSKEADRLKNLYDELVAINDLEAITEIEIDLEV